MYKEVETMTPSEFKRWWKDRDALERFKYNAFLFRHLGEGNGTELELSDGSQWEDFTPINSQDVASCYCRVKPKPKELKYRPYEKADPKWLGKTVVSIQTGNIFLIHGISSAMVEFSGNWNVVNLMMGYYKWYDIETGETSPFGEAYYE